MITIITIDITNFRKKRKTYRPVINTSVTQTKSIKFSDLFLADRWRVQFIKTSSFIIKVSMVVSREFKCARIEVLVGWWAGSESSFIEDIHAYHTNPDELCSHVSWRSKKQLIWNAQNAPSRSRSCSIIWLTIQFVALRENRIKILILNYSDAVAVLASR